ncbi:MAG: hypothetical protein JXQ73_15265 [Phycisphaerae bacterium]|nr:hypothetical protein [Phycisphaerae bacterium]
MRSEEHGCTRTLDLPSTLAFGVALLAGCTPMPSVDPNTMWPTPSEMTIWAVEPSTTEVLGLDGDVLTIRWNDAILPDTQPTIRLRLIPDDPNSGIHVLATGIDAISDDGTDEWPFTGRDINGDLVPIGTYAVEYTIDDGQGDVDAVNSTGRFTVPFRFTSPVVNTTISQDELQATGLTVSWRFQSFGAITRLDVGLAEDPNDPNGILWTSAGGMVQGYQSTDPTSLVFNGTVYDSTNMDETDPNSFLIPAGTYVVVGRMIATGTGGKRFFTAAPGRVTVVASP